MQLRLPRSELTRAISNRSFPKGRTRNEESSALSRKRPNIPSRRKNLKIGEANKSRTTARNVFTRTPLRLFDYLRINDPRVIQLEQSCWFRRCWIGNREMLIGL